MTDSTNAANGYTIAQLEAMLAGITQGEWHWVKAWGWELQGADNEKVLDDGSADDEYSRSIEPDSPDGVFVASAPVIARQLLATMRENAELRRQRERALAVEAREIVPTPRGYSEASGEGWNECRDEMRKALGVGE